MKSKFLYSVAFFLSGVSALLFQVAWQRLLTVCFGIGCDSITTIVSLYMFGLGIGGLCGGIFAKKLRHPLLAYIGSEFVIGILGIFSTHVLLAPDVSPLLICAFLAVPTFLMGLTLPFLVEHLSRISRNYLASVSMLYCANTLGAAVGAILGAYVLISFGGLDTAIYFASGVNFALALLVLIVLKVFKSPVQFQYFEVDDPEIISDGLGKVAYLAAFMAGFLAIAYEIIWFRTNEILVKASPYAFATTLGLYLFGLSVGSFALNKFFSKQKINRLNLFLMLQSGISLYVLASYMFLYLGHDSFFKSLIAQSFGTILHPPVTIDVGNAISIFGSLDFILWPAYFILPPTILMGAAFPLVSSLAIGKSNNSSRAIGLTYFFNVMGNVAGGIIAGLFFLDMFGAATTILILSALSLPFMILWIQSFRELKSRALGFSILVIVLIMVGVRFPRSSDFIASLHVKPDKACRVFVQEGRDATVVTFERENQIWNYINGLPHGGRLNYTHGYYARAIEGLSYSQHADKVLIIGYGTGAIVEAVLRCPEVKEVTVVELSKSVMQNLKKVSLFQNLLNDSRLKIVIEDGRRYLQETDTKYDAIMMDPVRSTTAYSNNIYSREFFLLAKDHLNSGGTIMVWLDNKLELPRTIASVFENVRLYWASCVASKEPLVENKDRRAKIMHTFSSQDQEEIAKAEGYSCDRAFIQHYTQGHGLIRDLKPRTEYYLGLLFGKNKSEVSPN